MRPALQLRLGQQLTLTPQLQQALRLLALPAAELERELQAALDANVMLEAGDAPGDDPAPVESDWDSAEPCETWTGAGGSRDLSEHEPMRVEVLDLRSQLLAQLPECRLSATDESIAIALIDALDEHGYLAEPVATIAAEVGVDEDEVEAVRHRLQRLDPTGVAAVGLADCLAVQLTAFDPATPALATARTLVTQHLEALAHPRRAALCATLGIGDDELSVALRLIRSLHPRPAALLPGAEPEYVRPDASVRRRGGRWVVELNLGSLPVLRINEPYASALGRGSDPTLRAQLAEARWLVKSLAMRHATLLRVATSIVERQVGFLERGAAGMRPLQLKEIAAALGLHESTVSRVAAGKYLLTPRGMFEFRYFFSGRFGAADGGAHVSATAVLALIERLVQEEDPQRPLSDSAIVEALAARGVRVARRTVTKYREALAIPASYDRRRTEEERCRST